MLIWSFMDTTPDHLMSTRLENTFLKSVGQGDMLIHDMATAGGDTQIQIKVFYPESWQTGIPVQPLPDKKPLIF